MKSHHLHFREDKGKRVLASFKPSAGLACYRVEALRKEISNLRLASLGNAALPLLGLVLWEAVIALADLRPAWVALNAPRRWRGKAFITWRAEDETHQRRFLTPFTLIAATQCRTLPPFEVAEEAIRDVFAARGLCSHSAVPSALLQSLLDDTAAWAFAWLPPYLAMHVTAARRLACLPDSCLAREVSDRPIVARGEGPESEQGLIDTLFHATEICPSDGFCKHLNEALAAPTELSDVRLRKLILFRLRKLFSIEGSWSLSEALIGAWSHYLIEVGTPDTSPLDPRTAIEYVRLILNELFKLLSRVLDAGVEDVAAWAKLHADILAAIDEGSRHKAHAALTAFQTFAAEYIGAPHPQELSRPYQPVDKAPRANVVWPAEITWVREQLAQLPESRFHLQVCVMFELLLFTGARVGELGTVAMENLRPHGDKKLLVVLDPRPLDDRLKTVTSRRSFVIKDKSCIELVSRWIARRVLESAKPHELCFGDPYGVRCVWRETETQSTIGWYLKAASGDRQLSPHSLRHSLITLTALSAGSDTDLERLLHALSASVGHESTSTTLAHYFHGADEQLRNALHRAAAGSKVTQRAASEWLGYRQDRFRKRVSRCSLDSSAYITHVLEQAASSVPIPTVSDDFEMGVRRCLYVPKKSTQRVPLQTVLHICKDLHGGLPCTAVAARSDVNPLEIRKIASLISERAGLSSNRALSNTQWNFRVAEAFHRVSSFADFTRLDQPILQSLLTYGSRLNRALQLEAASLSWESTRSGSYISLERPSTAIDLLTFLANAGVSASRLVVRLAPRQADDRRETLRLERNACERIVAVFSKEPSVERCEERRGRPRAYLLIRTSEKEAALHEAHPASAQLALGGFHAFMFGACLWRELNQQVRA